MFNGFNMGPRGRGFGHRGFRPGIFAGIIGLIFFGPAILASLFWRRATRNGILAGIIVGGLTVLIWKQLALFGLYEIIPGFFLSCLAIFIVSKLDREPSPEITAGVMEDECKALLQEFFAARR